MKRWSRESVGNPAEPGLALPFAGRPRDFRGRSETKSGDADIGLHRASSNRYIVPDAGSQDQIAHQAPYPPAAGTPGNPRKEESPHRISPGDGAPGPSAAFGRQTAPDRVLTGISAAFGRQMSPTHPLKWPPDRVGARAGGSVSRPRQQRSPPPHPLGHPADQRRTPGLLRVILLSCLIAFISNLPSTVGAVARAVQTMGRPRDVCQVRRLPSNRSGNQPSVSPPTTRDAQPPDQCCSGCRTGPVCRDGCASRCRTCGYG